MAKKIYKLWMGRFTEAWYQLSEEEQNSRLADVAASLENVGGKEIVTCASAWSSEQWLVFGVEEYPDIEAVQKHTEFLFEQNHFRYIEGETLLGHRWSNE